MQENGEVFMWAEESVFYHIYPLGLCGAPLKNDGERVPRIGKVLNYIDHIDKLGCNAVYFGPVFSSDAHGYDTRDFRTLDCRLGEEKDFAGVCRALHQKGIRVVLDGVFNHVGRGFWAFQDVLRDRECSRYKDWFHIDFGGNNGYGDGLWYEGWEGHYELVKLNLWNEEVVRHLFECIRLWVERYDIDGLRLDVAYSLPPEFLKRLHAFCKELKPDFFLLGEMLHGDYNRLMNEEMLDSATNYECYKGLYSSMNSYNLFEITHSLLRQFGPENWSLYKGKHLLAFVDNHDVTRIASILREPRHLPLVYALLFGMPGIPCVYYGSEWGVKGEKREGDPALRPAFDRPEENALTQWVARCASAHRESRALCYGGFRSIVLTNRQVIFERACEGERVLVGINIDAEPYCAHFDAGCGTAVDLLTGETHDFGGGSVLQPFSAVYWRMER
jgi:cyclomaltodextrinase